MNFFDNCKQCSIIVGNGSGVLFQPKDANYSYILTAKHNLKNKKNIQFKFKKIYKHKSLDIAIIKIKEREFISPKIQITEPKNKETYKLYGYPSNRREEKIKIQAFDLIIRDIHNKYQIIVFNEDYDSEQVDINGCSGGGVFKEENQDFLLAGIECRMDKESAKEENNTRLRFISIKAFDEIVEKYSDELVYLDDSKNIKDNTIKEVIPLKNGKSLTLKFVEDKLLFFIFLIFIIVFFRYTLVWYKGDNDISVQHKRRLNGTIQNRENNRIYYLFRKDDLDIKTISEKNGIFIFDDIIGEHDIEDNLYILCCTDTKATNCRDSPTECKIGEKCDIY